ncbi:hypothetical protein AAE02nite_36090 [Adhaeribacter aerolatus]|uniref:Uncharacterized protein n=1 Tax=Adhaeribacter aerolatus TaxID=670289 RepID=A0A512B1V0_9BACT|nr:hypothetical protein [Adhaeribacter aerolatus]GEO05945.1 hypothetical protein AAE02nite_36090 [Adhaeribacter aerolatus]
MIINILPSKKLTGLLILLLPFLFSCSALTGGSASNDPNVIAQQQQVDYLEQELEAQKRRTDEAEQLYKRERDLLDAKKSELKAAERLLKVYRDQAK